MDLLTSIRLFLVKKSFDLIKPSLRFGIVFVSVAV